MSQRSEFDIDTLSGGSKDVYQMSVSLAEVPDLAETIAMISGDRTVLDSVRGDIDSAIEGSTRSCRTWR